MRPEEFGTALIFAHSHAPHTGSSNRIEWICGIRYVNYLHNLLSSKHDLEIGLYPEFGLGLGLGLLFGFTFLYTAHVITEKFYFKPRTTVCV